MKFNKLLLLLTVLLIGGVFYFSKPLLLIDECNNVYSSDTYSHYREQFNTFVQSHPDYAFFHASAAPSNAKVKTFIELAEAPLKGPEEKRLSHEKFIHSLRELVQGSARLSPAENAFVKDIIKWIYTEVDLRDDFSQFIYKYVDKPKGDLLSYLSETQRAFHDNPRFDGTKSSSFYEDGFLRGNLPSVAFSGSARVIRMSKPIYFPSKISYFFPQVTPEFLAFVNLQTSHLYINLMKRGGSESRSSNVLENLESVSPKFHLVTLDKNSAFYNQEENKFPSTMESTVFMNKFVKEMLKPNGTYYWSAHIDRAVWDKELQDIVSEVNKIYFNARASLTRGERRDFIELSYLLIIDRLAAKIKPESINFTCNQGIDRAPSLMALWLYKNQNLANEEIASLLVTPPLLYHNRSSFSSRIDRFISAAKRIKQDRK